jgi:hypothetical protein
VTGIELPALDGTYALGFLAALGTQLLVHGEHPGVLLAWDPQTSRARLHSGALTEVEAVVDVLVDVVRRIPDEGVLPGVGAGFPPTAGLARDPLRVPAGELAGRVQQWQQTSPSAGHWCTSLVTDLAQDRNGNVAITPFAAPSGQQKFRTYFDKPLHLVRANPQARLREALTSWIRTPGYTGEYLDHRVLNSATDASDGRSAERGVPGATWLATMALPLFTVYGSSGRQCTGWHAIPGERRLTFVWPLWHQPLDIHAIRALLDHPAITPRTSETGQLEVNADACTALGIWAVHAATRRPITGRDSEGVLAPRGDGDVVLR